MQSSGGIPRWLMSKESTCNAGDAGEAGLIPGLERSPGGGHGNPLQYSCLENPHGPRSLAGYSPYGCKELDMNKYYSTEQVLLLPVCRQKKPETQRNYIIYQRSHG